MLLVFAQCYVKFFFGFVLPHQRNWSLSIYIPISVSVRIVHTRACDFFCHSLLHNHMEMGRVFFLVCLGFLCLFIRIIVLLAVAKRLINQRSIKLLSSTFIIVPSRFTSKLRLPSIPDANHISFAFFLCCCCYC